MNSIERESLLKSFLLFFISLSLLFGVVIFMQYKESVKSVDDDNFNKMKICSFDLKCEEFIIDFVERTDELPYTLYKEGNLLYSYFDISKSESYVIKFTLAEDAYLREMQEIKNDFLLRYLLISLVIVIVSSLFSLYALNPLRSALILTEEFIKDILHDFNTPLSSLRLNADMLKKEIGENAKILRIEKSVESVLSLQENLRSYLSNHVDEKKTFFLKELIDDRVMFVGSLYPKINFKVDVENLRVNCNKDALSRIIDNILTNAAKYNKKEGAVFVSNLESNNVLQIKDTGRGIKNPHKVFRRFYKEHERGLGIGLHIVKKLSDELGIKISLESEIGEGTTFYLDISSLTVR